MTSKRRLMRRLLYALLSLQFFNGNPVFAVCDFDNPEKLFEAIKVNHPQIKYNTVAIDSVKNELAIAKQRPNPELDAEGTVSDSIDGDIYSFSASLKHAVEFGGKYNARVKAAKAKIGRDKEQIKLSSEETIIEIVMALHKLRQLHELIPLDEESIGCLLYTSPSPRDATLSRMPSSA